MQQHPSAAPACAAPNLLGAPGGVAVLDAPWAQLAGPATGPGARAKSLPCVESPLPLLLATQVQGTVSDGAVDLLVEAEAE